jgi:hypothetical protein
MNIVELFTLHLAVYFVEKSSQKFVHLYRYEKCRELFFHTLQSKKRHQGTITVKTTRQENPYRHKLELINAHTLRIYNNKKKHISLYKREKKITCYYSHKGREREREKKGSGHRC